jgi:uncharacterized membrane protein
MIKNPAAKGFTLILALAFLALGSVQVWRPKQDVFNLVRLGFPEWMVSMIGFAEMGGGVLLIIPSCSSWSQWTGYDHGRGRVRTSQSGRK